MNNYKTRILVPEWTLKSILDRLSAAQQAIYECYRELEKLEVVVINEPEESTDFGKRVKKRLIDIDKTQKWLIDQVIEKTGLYMDSSYMNRILCGRCRSQKVVSAISEILEIQEDEDQPA